MSCGAGDGDVGSSSRERTRVGTGRLSRDGPLVRTGSSSNTVFLWRRVGATRRLRRGQRCEGDAGAARALLWLNLESRMATKRVFQRRATGGAGTPGSDAFAPTILIAEDDAGFRTLLGSALRRDGYRVLEVDAGIPMLRRLQRAIDRDLEVPALVIADERMPGMRGLEAFRRARAKGWSGPLVLITAFADDEMVLEAWRLGVTLIRKPFDVEDLSMAARFLTARLPRA